ncbi:MAG: hypothetical protein F4139_01145 [Gemmatimonadetes bacterium]|nr:hypothetical protein [Gemmatimonadota bacterium]MYA64931.1 hypothetical protein [Gemmatimonadota bacterium]MYB98034.1 hypothetical protein [Gemmatimonadota bacterium]MYH51535.1 hypothetical protein [Gemmatimonadota bacterium]MYI45882.1 hypothetical protein [Gemmatimonadota bacterium]
MTRFLRPALATVTSASILARAGCAGHRGPPVPEIATLQPLNGEWVLASDESRVRQVQFASQDGYGFTEETMQSVVALLAIRAQRFVLEVSDSVLAVASSEPEFSFSLAMDGTPLEVRDEDGRLLESTALAWEEDAPVVRRTLPGTGWVSNRFELAAEGTLVITRTAAVRNYRGREVEATTPIHFVYARSTGSRP